MEVVSSIVILTNLLISWVLLLNAYDESLKRQGMIVILTQKLKEQEQQLLESNSALKVIVAEYEKSVPPEWFISLVKPLL